MIMTLYRFVMLLLRLLIVWPSMLAGCLVMLYVWNNLSGGEAGMTQRYATESSRWRDVPEGHVMVQKCPSVISVSGMYVDEQECPRTAISFGEAVAEDIRELKMLAVVLFLGSLFMEGVSSVILFRVCGSAAVSGEARGGPAVMPWTDGIGISKVQERRAE
ncbi:TPA: hypothetical protein ACHJ73_003202 [Escherichia coli]|nr:hypothetical protein [Escherichia coli]